LARSAGDDVAAGSAGASSVRVLEECTRSDVLWFGLTVVPVLWLCGLPVAESCRGDDGRADGSSAGGSDRAGGFGERGAAGHHVVDDDGRALGESRGCCGAHGERAVEVLRSLLSGESDLVRDVPLVA
jgi:hypothetical protein